TWTRTGSSTATWRDQAGKQGYSLAALENLVRDCEAQPEWRSNADLNVAYCDGKQLTEAQKHTLLHIAGRAQAVVACRVGQRCLAHLQDGLNCLGQRLRLQAAQHVDDVLGAHPT